MSLSNQQKPLMKDQNLYTDLILKDLTGELSGGEKELLEAWLGQDKGNIAFYADIKSALEEVPETVDDQTRTAYRKVAARLNFPPEEREEKTLELPAHRGQTYRIAAATILLLATTGVVWMLSGKKTEEPVAVVQKPSLPVFQTVRGQKKSITLDDSSVVVLNAESKLKVVCMNGSSREVQLQGEAFFKVTKDEKRPFIVHTRHADVRVMGTEFNVRNFPTDSLTTISVSEGSVLVSTPMKAKDSVFTRATRVEKGQELALVEYDNVLTVNNISLKNVAGWRKNILVFRSRPFAEITSELERMYDVEIETEQKALSACLFTASFENLPIQEVMVLLQRTGKFKFNIKGRKIRITGGSCR
jgi:transmembrane sensor